MSSDYTGVTIVGVGVAKQTVSVFFQSSVCVRDSSAADAALP